MKIVFAFTLYVSCVLHVFSPATAQNVPQYQSPFVNDFAEIIDAETEARITTALQNAKKLRGLEFTVVTIHSRLDYGSTPNIEAFAIKLFNTWGVGNADRNDGIVVLVAVGDRDMRIELGSGYPNRYDARMQSVIDNYFLPYFRNDQYARGIEAGVLETLKRTYLEYGPNNRATFGSQARNEGAYLFDHATSGGWLSWVLGLFALGVGGLGGSALWQRRPRRCVHCERVMQRLSETQDDAHLSHGQQMEEALKSKNYDVWYCQHDDHVLILGRRLWFSKYAACKNCKFHTSGSKRRVISAATTSHSGSARVSHTCENCKHHYTETVVIPRITKSSSSSGGSAFGGGSSSGGGASGSW